MSQTSSTPSAPTSHAPALPEVSDVPGGCDSPAGAETGVGAVPEVGERADLAALQRRLAEFALAREWGQYHTPKNLSAALSVEAGELVEIFQWLTPEQSARIMRDPDQAARVEDEVADVLAYLLQFCEVLEVDVLAALAAKIDRNERRFPAARQHRSAAPAEAQE